MLQEPRFALYAIKKNIQNNAELRTSFIMNVVGMCINNLSFIVLWVYFIESVGVIGGWTAPDIVALQGFVALSFGVIFSAGFGIIKLPEYVSSGAFDRFMLSPKNLLTRVATSAFSSSAVGDVLFGILCLSFYVYLIQASIYQTLLIIFFVSVAVVVFLSMAIIVHATAFFFVDAGMLVRSIFEIFLTPSLFHGGAFQGTMRLIFTFLIPSLLIGTIPVESVRDLSLQKVALVMLLSLCWFILSLKLFKLAVKKYESANFMTFGN